jgi:hypothetical protein
MIAELEKIEAIKAAREDLAKQSAASALEIWKNFNESKYADEQNALNKKYKKEEELLKKQLDNKLITQQQYDAKLAQIQKKKDAEELKLKQKKFNDEKIMAVAKIAIETAINVVKASLTSYLIPYIIGLGAAQAAVVLSQPLPKYAKGRKGGEAEWAIVGEEGREAMIADGNVYLTPDKPTLAYLPKGADVIPNRELMRSMINTPSFATNIYESIQLKDSIDRGFINLSQVVKNKKETHIIINEKGLTKIVKNGNNYATYLNNNIVL